MNSLRRSALVVCFCAALAEETVGVFGADEPAAKGGKGKERNIEEWKVKKDSVKFKATQVTANYSDKLDFEIKAKKNDGLETKVKYEITEVGSPAKAKFEMNMKLFKIIEFRNVDGGVEGFDSGDEILQSYILGEPKGGKKGKKQGDLWADMGEINDVVNADVKSFSAKTADGVLEVIGRYAGKPATFTKTFSVGADGASTVSYDYELYPNNVKFDYIIRDFPFMGNDTMLAFDGRFKTKTKVKTDKDNKYAIDAPIDEDGELNRAALFTWSPTVNVDGVEKNVTFSLKDVTAEENGEELEGSEGAGEANMKAVWTIMHTGRASTFVWDPTISSDTEDSKEDASSATTSLEVTFVDGGNGQQPMRMMFLFLCCLCSLRVA